MTKTELDTMKDLIQAYGVCEALRILAAACSSLSCDIAKDNAHEALRLLSISKELDGMSVEYEESFEILA